MIVYCILYNDIMKTISLIELSSPGCQICRMFEEFWKSIETDWPTVKYENISVATPEGQSLASKYMIFSSPGIIINGELFSSGGFDKEKFIVKLKELSREEN